MRVIAGKAKGTRLAAPKGLAIRPTLDRVREALFSILGGNVEGARFLDLFAGTGANGIEALSRGADYACLVDANAQALSTVRHNLEASRLAPNAACLQLHLPSGLRRLDGAFDLVFADPPYDFSDYAPLLEGLCEHGLISPGGQVVIEHRKGATLPPHCGRLDRQRESKYGSTHLSFYT